MNSKTLIKTLDGIEIYIDPETGRFEAKINGKLVKKRTLRDVEKEIEGLSKAVTAYDLSTYDIAKPERVEISRFESGRARLKDGKLARRYEIFYILDTETLSKILNIYERERILIEEYKALIKTLPRVNESNFQEIRENQKTGGN